MHEEKTNLHTSFHSIAHHQTEGCSSERMDCSAERRIGNVSTSPCSFLFDCRISKIGMRKKQIFTSCHSIAYNQTEGCSSERMDCSTERRIGNVSTTPCYFLFDYHISKIGMREYTTDV
ncbi:hypothetical protein HNY73_017611 [Argiope bruennichi]|uniref:Uncharacterized protein n=1 Tax=Argiope bruennichi TaxID=94029 RepID=A0A8T0EBA3_ARGBR|nr:hypothetical protein HNY73_017611 [Argiope bruennichi]